MKSRKRAICTHLFLILLGFAYMATAEAQKLQVKSANPSTAVQGTFGLDVEITGNGFDNSAVADFFVTGSTNPGGIVVTNVRFVNSRKLIATIDVIDTAIVDFFDIEITLLSSGRRGRGTTLFSVQQQQDGAPTNEMDLTLEPIVWPGGAGLLTRHAEVWIFDYNTRNNAPACPASLADTDWAIRIVRDLDQGDIVYSASQTNLIIDVLAASVGFDGCHGSTGVDLGTFELRKRKFGKGKKAYCAGRMTWTFDYANTANGIEYVTLQSVGPNDDGWIRLTGPLGSNLTTKELCNNTTDHSVFIDGTFEFTRTDDSGTQLLGIIDMGTIVVFHYPDMF